MTQDFLIRLFIVIGVVWFTQLVLDALSIKEPAHKAIFILVLIIGIIALVAPAVLPLR